MHEGKEPPFRLGIRHVPRSIDCNDKEKDI